MSVVCLELVESLIQDCVAKHREQQMEILGNINRSHIEDLREPHKFGLPEVLDLATPYETLLRTLMPMLLLPQEKLADLVLRLGKLNALQRDIQKTQAQLAKEKQFNRKVGINAQLRALKAELQGLRP